MKKNKEINKPLKIEFGVTGSNENENLKLVLYNDDINTFDYVMSCLIEVCDHNIIQAEQCAMITHYKGKCDIKKGSYSKLQVMKEQLIEKGLRVSIE
ncbi:MAG: ATP-dependent Clp protease adaptor ClpS [Bacteroidales bacterium]|jgi:ATP-dependent Clp protease adaptor protein ClpS|nr:ATP-dependent Clp protease adaptor ClpS [Bacteroidales bacterium]HOL98740.1 ATP-dependent Clp protease adaptor ClpS [Bacteroidales bacterium]HOM36181.1 ATP-dependent Clp protease adaptor ClpS [Bacteroidales bacterium]HPD23497.1 ATP-dependent Clp protease adaptor ClpS [Bacteroidales bacterium]HRS99629.1 ATP-dependent Clp protease adaptor ClpS [Bacteroidales bacterium]